MSRRLIPAAQVDEWAAQLQAAVDRALDAQRDAVLRVLGAHGIQLSVTAASKKGRAAGLTGVVAFTVWDQDQWAKLVDAQIQPVAQSVADDAVVVASSNVSTSTAGMPSNADAISAAIASAAIASGAYLGQRMNNAAASSTDPSDDIADVLATSSAIVGGVVAGMALAAANSASGDVSQFVTSTTGVLATHSWNSVLGETTRPWHADADGQEVPVGQPFIVDGEEMMYPGDSAGSDENTINCQCWEEVDGLDSGQAAA